MSDAINQANSAPIESIEDLPEETLENLSNNKGEEQ